MRSCIHNLCHQCHQRNSSKSSPTSSVQKPFKLLPYPESLLLPRRCNLLACCFRCFVCGVWPIKVSLPKCGESRTASGRHTCARTCTARRMFFFLRPRPRRGPARTSQAAAHRRPRLFLRHAPRSDRHAPTPAVFFFSHDTRTIVEFLRRTTYRFGVLLFAVHRRCHSGMILACNVSYPLTLFMLTLNHCENS